MRHSRLQPAVLPISLLALVIVSSVSLRLSHGQSRDPNKTRVKRTAAVRARTSGGGSERPSAASAERWAASRNGFLSSRLNWTFGDKQQKGWYIYEPLIKRLLKTDNEPPSKGFARSLSKWQKRLGITSSGVLDEETLYAMISEWQEKRLKERSLATPDQLITAPPSDFYHPSRPEELRQVERKTYLAYRRLVKAAAADRSLGLGLDKAGNIISPEKYLKIISAFRSREYQEQLRRESPNAGRAGLAVNSPHFTGRALDFYVGGEPVETRDSNRAIQIRTRVYQWLVRNAERYGFRPYYYEPWHWEYVGK